MVYTLCVHLWITLWFTLAHWWAMLSELLRNANCFGACRDLHWLAPWPALGWTPFAIETSPFAGDDLNQGWEKRFGNAVPPNGSSACPFKFESSNQILFSPGLAMRESLWITMATTIRFLMNPIAWLTADSDRWVVQFDETFNKRNWMFEIPLWVSSQRVHWTATWTSDRLQI